MGGECREVRPWSFGEDFRAFVEEEGECELGEEAGDADVGGEG